MISLWGLVIRVHGKSIGYGPWLVCDSVMTDYWTKGMVSVLDRGHG